MLMIALALLAARGECPASLNDNGLRGGKPRQKNRCTRCGLGMGLIYIILRKLLMLVGIMLGK